MYSQSIQNSWSSFLQRQLFTKRKGIFNLQRTQLCYSTFLIIWKILKNPLVGWPIVAGIIGFDSSINIESGWNFRKNQNPITTVCCLQSDVSRSYALRIRMSFQMHILSDVSIGFNVAPILTNIYMALLKNELKNKCNTDPKLIWPVLFLETFHWWWIWFYHRSSCRYNLLDWKIQWTSRYNQNRQI